MQKEPTHFLLSVGAICVICGFSLASARAQVATGTPAFGSFRGGPAALLGHRLA